MSRDSLTTVAVVLIAASAVVLTVTNVRREFFRPPTRPFRVVPEWETYATTGHRVGPDSAALTIVAFFDYECPGCRTLHLALADLLERYPMRMAVVWRHFPLDGHRYARPVARAAVCAAGQGRFASFHRVAFTSASRFGAVSLQELAHQAGVVDTASFAACLRSEDPDLAIEGDRHAALDLGVAATPTFLIADGLYVGVPSDFEKVITRALGL